jgi:hypothetical protein
MATREGARARTVPCFMSVEDLAARLQVLGFFGSDDLSVAVPG